MKSFEHVYRLHRMLKAARYPVPFERVQAELECSRATTKRVIAYVRDFLGAPIESSREPRGYRYTDAAYELPGVWFTAEELQGLLTLQQLLATFQPGLLDELLTPMKTRIDQILKAQGLSADNAGRVRLLRAAARAPGRHFTTIASSVLQRRRLHIEYEARSTGQVTEREISPQRLTHYRDNWYLDAWCHRSAGLRTFALDCIRGADLLDQPAQDVSETQLNVDLGSSYGIFSGAPTATAVLRFTPERARWVAEERWHPQQQGWFDGEHYFLEIPYSDDRELVLDILRHGPEVEVLRPKSLRAKVLDQLLHAAAQYRKRR